MQATRKLPPTSPLLSRGLMRLALACVALGEALADLALRRAIRAGRPRC